MTGYDQLATLFGKYEDLAMFRTFTALNAKNLLYMQAELLHLQKDLEDQVEFDSDPYEPAKNKCCRLLESSGRST